MFFGVIICRFLFIFILPVSGQVLVFPGSTNYTTVNAAFAAINSGLHTGAIIIEIHNHTTEPAIITPLQASGVGLANYVSVVIKTTGNYTISGNNSGGGIIELLGADNVSIDGDAVGGGVERQLTIQNTSVSSFASGIRLIADSTSIAGNCQNIIVQNCIISGNVYSPGTGLIANGLVNGTNGYGPIDLIVTNCSFRSWAVGIGLYGVIGSGVAVRPTISENDFGDKLILSQTIYQQAIAVIAAETLQIIANRFHRLYQYDTVDIVGISCRQIDSIYITQNRLTHFENLKSNITGIKLKNIVRGGLVSDNILEKFNQPLTTATLTGIIVDSAEKIHLLRNQIINFNSGVGNCRGIVFVNFQSQASIERNHIISLHAGNVYGASAQGIIIDSVGSKISSLITYTVLIVNNMIADLSGAGDYHFAGRKCHIGIGLFGNSRFIKIYYNSIHLYGNQSFALAAYSAGLYINNTCGQLDIRNNIFVNAIFNPINSAARAWCVYSDGIRDSLTIINYNNYWLNNNLQGITGFLNGTNRNTLTDWKNATLQDAQSQSVDPRFVTHTDLHIQARNIAFNDKGTAAVAGIINTDFDGQVRPVTGSVVPDMGADDFSPLPVDLAANGWLSPLKSAQCFTKNEFISLSVRNVGAGTTPGTGFTLNTTTQRVIISGMISGPFAGSPRSISQTFGVGSIGYDSTADFTIPLAIDLSNTGTYTFYNFSITCPADGNSLNDTFPTLILENRSPIVVAATTKDTVCGDERFELSGSVTISPTIVLTNDSLASIPDYSTVGVRRYITNNTITGINASALSAVNFRILHSYVGDLTIKLIAPNGSSIILAQRIGGDGDNYAQTRLVSSGATPITSGAAPFIGTYNAQEPFSLLTGTAAGTWQLVINDLSLGDAGTLIDWGLEFNNKLISLEWSSPEYPDFQDTILNPPIRRLLTDSGRFVLKAVDLLGCVSTDTVKVIRPGNNFPFVPRNPVLACIGSPITISPLVQFQGGNLTFLWFRDDLPSMMQFHSGLSYTTTPVIADTTLWIQPVVGRCTSAIRYPIIIRPTAAIEPPAAPSYSFACNNQRTTITLNDGIGNNIYYWYRNDLPSLSLFYVGNSYTTTSLTADTVLWVERQQGPCISPIRTSIRVNVLPVPNPITMNSPISVCLAGRATVVGTGSSGSYAWYKDNLATTPPFFIGSSYTTTPLTTDTTLYVAPIVSSCIQPVRSSVRINVTPLPNAPVLPETIAVCFGDRYVIRPSLLAGDSIVWYSSAGIDATILDSGSVSWLSPPVVEPITIWLATKRGKCLSSVRRKVTLQPITRPSPPVVPPVIYACSDEIVGVTAQSEELNVSYRWYYHAGPNAPVIFTGKTYAAGPLFQDTILWVETVKNGCPSAARSSVLIDYAQPPPPPNNLKFNPVCAFTPVTLTLPSVGNGIRYAWYSSNDYRDTIPKFVGNTYIASKGFEKDTVFWLATIQPGCTSQIRRSVKLTVYPIPPKPEVTWTPACFGEPVSGLVRGSGSTAIYSWFRSATDTVVLSNFSVYRTDTLYADTTFWVSAVVNGCTTARVATTIQIGAPPGAPAVKVPNDFCPGKRVEISVVPNDTFPDDEVNWYADSSEGSMIYSGKVFTTSPLFEDTFFWVGAKRKGCKSKLKKVPLSVYKLEPPVLLSETNTCKGSDLTLRAKAWRGSVRWFYADSITPITTADTLVLFNLVLPQLVWLGADDGNCASKKIPIFVTIQQPPRAFEIIAPDTVDFGQIFNIRTDSIPSNVQLKWDWGLSVQHFMDSLVQGPHLIAFKVINDQFIRLYSIAGTCSTQSTKRIFVRAISNSNSSIIDLTGKILIYPNPVTNRRIGLYPIAGIRKLKTELYNSAGQLVTTNEFSAEKSDAGNWTIDLQNYSNGVYYLKLITDENAWTEKIVITAAP
jgi:subtilisin-like proprotein convertase family protein